MGGAVPGNYNPAATECWQEAVQIPPVRIVRGLLKEIGCPQIGEAEDGSQALEMLKTQHFDFVVSDINMPRMNGFMLLRAIKEDPALQHVPVLIMSTHAAHQYSEASIIRGAVGYLEKPVSARTLRPLIERALADLTPPRN